MKIKMKTAIAGPGIVLSPGAVTEAFSGAEAERLIEKGMAEKVTAPKKRASKPKVEKAVLSDALMEDRRG